MFFIQNAVRGEVDDSVDSQIVVKDRLAAGKKVLGHEGVRVETVHGDGLIPRSTKTGNPLGARLHASPGTPRARKSRPASSLPGRRLAVRHASRQVRRPDRQIPRLPPSPAAYALRPSAERRAQKLKAAG